MFKDLKKLKNNKGQALIEFVFFIPFLVMLLVVLISVGNSINGSINQQKIARSYFFLRTQHNSMMPLKGDEQASWTSFGMSFIGWMERAEDRVPVLPCYKLSIPVGTEQECLAYEGTSTNFIRVGTVFGVCGASYSRSNSSTGQSEIFRAPLPGDLNLAAQVNGCLIR